MKRHVSNLRMEPVRKSEFLLFRYLDFRFFWNSPSGEALPMLHGNPAWLAPVIAIPYMLASLVHVHNFGASRYFIREGDEVAGIVVFKVTQDALSVRTLAVSPTKRGRGVGYFALDQAEKLAKKMRLQWLELDVLKDNAPAQSLFLKFGFKTCSEGKLTFVLKKRV